MTNITLKDFWAPWCPPCKAMNPVIEEIESEYPDMVQKINIDEDIDTAQKYGVMSIPTYVIEKDGKEIDRVIGVTTKASLLQKLAIDTENNKEQ